MLELNKLYLMDCMDGMAHFPDKFFELAIVDPPYGISINHNIGRRKGDKPSGYKRVRWDDAPPDQAYFDELMRVSQNQIIWGGGAITFVWSQAHVGCVGTRVSVSM